MRDIKFRAWDKVNKRWIKQFNIDLLNINIFSLPNIEINQYTGLKDKNEKEIYEGDILSSAFSKRIVIFDENTCSFMLKDIRLRNELFLLTKEKSKNLEIISNIYENGNLIGDEE
jgi:hypothetical protein fuD12_02509|uniref:YopX protein n=1 Tax=Myoviridae sp. ctfyA6 TaxID=2827698 RepID=A0A8S5STL3_9CAUD|nr:MAG TPA: YopX protein [Myoviridae sp. ctfyA6]